MKEQTKAPRRRWMAAAALILVLTLLFSGCTDTPRPADPSAGTTVPNSAADGTSEAVGTEAPATEAPVSLPAPDLDKTCWDASLGQSLNAYYFLQFQPDGTFRHYHFSTKNLGDSGRYSFDGSILTIEFQSGEDSFRETFRWDGTGFLSTEEKDMAVGKGYYTIAPNPEAAEFFADKPEQPVGALSLNRTDISFFGAGEAFTLIVKGVAAGTEVLWTSENEAIASVDENGTVTAVAPGTVKVFARIGEAELTCWVRCQFTAPEGEEAPFLNKTDISFFGVGESFLLSVQNVPEGEKVVWSSEDVHVASIDEKGRVTAVGPGTIHVAAQVGDVSLYCWVRCQFTIPAPRSSVADGSWLVNLYKDRVTSLGSTPADGYSAEADLLDYISVSKNELDRMENGSALDLTACGMKVYRVSEVRYEGGEARYHVAVESGPEMVFAEDDRGRWCLLSENGEFATWVSGSAKLIFAGNAVLLDEVSAVLSGHADPIRVNDLMDLFGRQSGYENTLPAVGVTVENGVVTQAIWHYVP